MPMVQEFRRCRGYSLLCLWEEIMTPKQIAENYRLASRAIDEGIKIRPKNWDPNEYIRFKDSVWQDEKCMQYDFSDSHFYDCVWFEHKEPAKLITWWRPKVIWRESNSSPTVPTKAWATSFKRGREEFLMDYDTEVLEWESIQAPETYEQCEGET